MQHTSGICWTNNSVKLGIPFKINAVIHSQPLQPFQLPSFGCSCKATTKHVIWVEKVLKRIRPQQRFRTALPNAVEKRNCQPSLKPHDWCQSNVDGVDQLVNPRIEHLITYLFWLLSLDKQMSGAIYRPFLAVNEAQGLEGWAAILEGVGCSTYASLDAICLALTIEVYAIVYKSIR